MQLPERPEPVNRVTEKTIQRVSLRQNASQKPAQISCKGALEADFTDFPDMQIRVQPIRTNPDKSGLSGKDRCKEVKSCCIVRHVLTDSGGSVSERSPQTIADLAPGHCERQPSSVLTNPIRPDAQLRLQRPSPFRPVLPLTKPLRCLH